MNIVRWTMYIVYYYIERGYSNIELNHDTNDAVIQNSNWIIWTLFICSVIVWHDRILNKLNGKYQAKSRSNKYAIHNNITSYYLIVNWSIFHFSVSFVHFWYLFANYYYINFAPVSQYHHLKVFIMCILLVGWHFTWKRIENRFGI